MERIRDCQVSGGERREQGMKVAVLGGTGFIGRSLIKHLRREGVTLLLFSRHPERYRNDPFFKGINFLPWTPERERFPHIEPVDVVINLAGETINQRWTKHAKERILTSRVDTTRRLVSLFKEGHIRAHTLINASAIGYYGTSFDRVFTENDPAGDDFLAQVTSRWEAEADLAAQAGLRVVKLRFGVVLGREGGALPRMVLPYRLFMGGTMGSGSQWVSWIHLHDVVRVIRFVAEQSSIEGPVNLTAPHPVQMKEFGQTIAEVLDRPHWLTAPEFFLRLVLGEMSDLILKGQRVQPVKLLEAGFHYKFPHLDDALRDLILE
jgi:hypothetical protein